MTVLGYASQMLEQPKKRELFHIAGDLPEDVAAIEPDRYVSGGFETHTKMDLASTALGHPKVLYRAKDGREFVLTVDIYALPDEPMKAVLICPMCSTEQEAHALDVKGDHKRIEYSASATNAMMLPNERGESTLTPLGGELSIERFGCTWEIDTKREVTKGDLRVNMRSNLCAWRVVIEKNIARDA